MPDLAKNYHRKHDYEMDNFREEGFPKTKTITHSANLCTGEGVIVTTDPQVIIAYTEQEGKP